MNSTKIAPKLDTYGALQWTALGMERDASGKYRNVGYVIIEVGSSKWVRNTTVHKLEVRKGNGQQWHVVLFGEVIETVRTKSAAQQACKELLGL